MRFYTLQSAFTVLWSSAFIPLKLGDWSRVLRDYWLESRATREDGQLLACCFAGGNGKGDNPRAIAEPLNPKSVKS
jgi:hypothetical protein